MERRMGGAVDEVVEWIAAGVREGRFQAQRLPSEKVLSERLRVSRSTVREAKARLFARGTLVGRGAAIVRSESAARGLAGVAEVRTSTSAGAKKWCGQLLRARRLLFAEGFARALVRKSGAAVERVDIALADFEMTVAPHFSEARWASAMADVSRAVAAASGDAVLEGLLSEVTQELSCLSGVWKAMRLNAPRWVYWSRDLSALCQSREARAVRARVRRGLHDLDTRTMQSMSTGVGQQRVS